MALSNVTINLRSGGLSRKSADENNTSGLLIYTTQSISLTGFTSTGGTVLVQSTSDAELTYGITSTNYPVEHFQIEQFFLANPSGKLYVGIFPSASTYTFAEITSMQNFSQGKIRRIGIQMNSFSGITTQVGTIQSICTTLYNSNKPLYVIYCPNTYSTNISSLTDLRSLNSKYVGVFIGQDNSGTGWELASGRSFTVSPIGKLLGFNAKSPVNYNVGWVDQFNFVTGTENSSLMIGTSSYFNILDATLTTLDSYGYMFLMKRDSSLTGSYLNDMHACTSATDDFAYLVETNVINKSIRNVRTNLISVVNSPITMNADGTISYKDCKYFESLAGTPLDEMLRLGELSNYKVFVDPDQDVLSTSTVNVTVSIQPTATARYIVVNIGFTTTI